MSSILPIIREGISLIRSDKQLQIGIYYPSTINYCMRKTYYSYFEAEEHDLETHKNFVFGIGLHNLVQKGLDFYAKNHPEVKVISEPEDNKEEFYYHAEGISLHGRPDTLLITPTGTHILEFKSHGSISDRYLSEPQANHLSQLNYYLHFYPQAEGHIIYMNKAKKNGSGDYQEFKEFAGIHYDEALFRQLVRRAWTLHGYLEEKKLPPAEAYLRGGMNDYECRSCSFKESCMKGVIQERHKGK